MGEDILQPLRVNTNVLSFYPASSRPRREPPSNQANKELSSTPPFLDGENGIKNSQPPSEFPPRPRGYIPLQGDEEDADYLPPGFKETLEYRLRRLQQDYLLEENKHQRKNIYAVIQDLKAKGATAEFYQDGEPVYVPNISNPAEHDDLAQEFDEAKGPVWSELLGAFKN
ncbi:hypothetical protein TWF730_007633 [Orbilia blumenaviensis]|uniref:Uncharacterized protein n=1 Tax=Orbilia blumenaviensis TaxID=1796055 RepID=A0AAV9V8W1_9PEZI